MASLSPASTQPAGDSFAALFEESLTRKEMRIGEVITAEVVSVDDNFVVVNAGLKSESIIPSDEFRNDTGQVDVKPGDFVSVSIEALEDGYGATRLSRDKAKRMAAWLELEKALESGEKVEGVITGKVTHVWDQFVVVRRRCRFGRVEAAVELGAVAHVLVQAGERGHARRPR
jgi:small subunit ribosomal protein S1